MLMQTNSYIVPKDKRTEHARLIMRFRQTLARIGCDHFEAYEQVGANWSPTEATGRFVQIMRFRDRKHQQQVQAAERSDPAAQALIKEFCELINFPYQQQQGLFAVGFYTSILPGNTPRIAPPPPQARDAEAAGGTFVESETPIEAPSSWEPAAPPDLPEPAPAQQAPEPSQHPDDSGSATLGSNGPLEVDDTFDDLPPEPPPLPAADQVEDLALEELEPDDRDQDQHDPSRPIER